jgi:hypothetical protein
MIRQTLGWGYCDVPSVEGLDWARVAPREVERPRAAQ